MATPQVVVVGTGPAGIRATLELVNAGLRPIVVDEGSASGGQIYRRQPSNFSRPPAELYGTETNKAVSLHTAFDKIIPHIDYRPLTLAWAIAKNTLQTIRTVDDKRVGETVSFDSIVIASGATDRILPVKGWTKPGCYTLGGTQIALKVQGCAIGQRVLLLGTGPLLYLLAWQYLKAGHPPVAILDTSPFRLQLLALPWLAARPLVLWKGMRLVQDLQRAMVPIHRGIVPREILGPETAVSAVRFTATNGKEHTIECDAVAMGYHIRAESQLADLAGCEFSFDPFMRQWLPQTDDFGRSTVAGVYLAGDCTRLLGADGAEVAGSLAAKAVISDLMQRAPSSETALQLRLLQRNRRFASGIARAFPLPSQNIAEIPDDTILCRCEEVTVGEVRAAATELGAEEVNRAKAFSRAGMGRCQGRFCGAASQEIVSAQRKVPVESAGRLRSQAPVKPLPVSMLIGARDD